MTSTKSFLTISKKECLVVYKELIANSDANWAAGKTLAEAKHFGSAISLAIISVEELVKALILLADGKGFNLRSITGIDALFKNHKIRYLIAYAMFAMRIMGEEFAALIKKCRENPSELIRINKGITQGDEDIQKRVLSFLFRKAVIFRREFNWFSKVDLFRQDGFYCDYNEQLKNPIKISDEEYQEVFTRLEKVRITGQDMVNFLNDTDSLYVEQLTNLQDDFKNKKYYELLGRILGTIRKTKESPFDFIKQRLPIK